MNATRYIITEEEKLNYLSTLSDLTAFFKSLKPFKSECPQEPNGMKIQPLLGTGSNWDNSLELIGNQQKEINSTITGFKIFAFSSFDPGKEYPFKINPGDLDYRNVDYPINIYLFSLDSSLKALLSGMLLNLDLNDIRLRILPTLKRGSWAA